MESAGAQRPLAISDADLDRLGLVPAGDGTGEIRVHAMRPEHAPVLGATHAAAFFDLDRTLIAGSSLATLGLAAWRAGLVGNAQMLRDGLDSARFALAGSSDANTERIKRRTLGSVRGQRRDDLLALNESILPRLLARIRPEARRLIELHREARRATYIVSASPAELVEPLAVALGMTGGIGTKATVVEGRYTGELAGPFCYGAGKVEALATVARWEGFDLAECYAYSDSASDLPMLHAVGHPVAVNPDGHLQRVALANGWPIVVFSRRTKAVIRRLGAAATALGLVAGGFGIGLRQGRSQHPGLG